MPTTKSAKKRMRQSANRREDNRARKSTGKTVEKAFRAKVAAKDFAAAEPLLRETISILEKGSKTNAVHPNKVSRKKSRLMALLHTAQQAKA